MLKLNGKNVVIGVTGGIAVYKVCTVVRLLKKLGANVDVIMTEHATEFVSPLTFETLANSPVVTDMFAPKTHFDVEHISLAKKADLFLVCPATANIVGKFANGIADDMLSTTLMATKAPVIIAPAMNTNMYKSDSFNANLQVLKSRGVLVVSAGTGFLACGDNGEGRMAEPEEIVSAVESVLCPCQDYAGKKVLVTSGATIEKLDDVRYITNFSSGKMGCAVAERALMRGAEVTLVLAHHTAKVPDGAKVIDVETTAEMHEVVLKNVADADVIVMAAAPCDYKPEKFSESKIKSEQLTISFVKNPDIAKDVGKIKGDKYLVVFSAETDHGIENATKKLHSKNADLAVLNDVKHNDVFGSDTNVVTLITTEGATSFDKMSKTDVADVILDRAIGK